MIPLVTAVCKFETFISLRRRHIYRNQLFKYFSIAYFATSFAMLNFELCMRERLRFGMQSILMSTRTT